MMAGTRKPPSHDGALGGPERRHAAVRPGEDLGAVVGREDDDRVVGLADVVKLFEQFADVVIYLRHAGFFQAIVRLVVLIDLYFSGQVCQDVHARRVVPYEERLAVAASPCP